MDKYKWASYHNETSQGEWTSWHMHEGFMMKAMNDGKWTHNLQSHPDESNPDANHVHYKFISEKGNMHTFVLCSVKVDGMREINRRELIEDINDATGLNLSYR